MALQELFAVENDPHRGDPNRVTLFYASSWALMHYIMLGDDSKRLLPAVDSYLKLIDKGTDPGVAGFQAFGDLAELEKSLRRYLRSPLGSYTLELPVEVEDKAFPIRTLTPAESLTLLGNFLAHGTRPVNALPLLEEALSLDPTSAIAHESMGYLRFRQDEPDEAARWFEKAVELDSGSFLSHYYMAMLAEETDEPERTVRAEHALKTSIDLNPRFAPAYAALANHYTRLQQNQDEALQLALKARELEPANPSNWLTVGSALLTLERLHEANAVGERALSMSKNAEARTAAVDFLQFVQEHAHYFAARYQAVLGMAEIEEASSP